MKHWLGLFGVLLLAGVAASVVAWHHSAPIGQQHQFDEIEIGMAYSEVVKRMGPEATRDYVTSEDARRWKQPSGHYLFWRILGNAWSNGASYHPAYLVRSTTRIASF